MGYYNKPSNTITIKVENDKVFGVDEKGQHLAIYKRSLEKHKPKDGELWWIHTQGLHESIQLKAKYENAEIPHAFRHHN